MAERIATGRTDRPAGTAEESGDRATGRRAARYRRLRTALELARFAVWTIAVAAWTVVRVAGEVIGHP